MQTRRVFVDPPSSDGMVVLNWQESAKDEIRFVAAAYHQVAREAIAALRGNSCFGTDGIPIEDFRAYPIVFLYRHALELHMKAVILAGAPMLMVRSMKPTDERRILSTHRLEDLLPEVEQVFTAYEWKWDFGNSYCRSVEDFRTMINEIHTIDVGSYAFRYPIKKDGTASLPSHFRFDLFEFCGVLDKILPALEGAAIGAGDEFEARSDLMAEAVDYENLECDTDDGYGDYD